MNNLKRMKEHKKGSKIQDCSKTFQYSCVTNYSLLNFVVLNFATSKIGNIWKIVTFVACIM